MIKDFNAPGADERAVLLTADQQSFLSARGDEFRFWNSTLLVRAPEPEIDLLVQANAELDKAVADQADAAVIGELYLKRNKLQQQQEQDQARQGKGMRVFELTLELGKTFCIFDVRFMLVETAGCRTMLVHAEPEPECECKDWLPLDSKLLTARQNLDLWSFRQAQAANIVLDPDCQPPSLEPGVWFWLAIQTADKTKTVAFQVRPSTYISGTSLALIDLSVSPAPLKSIGPIPGCVVRNLSECCQVLFHGLTWEQVKTGEGARQFGLEGPLSVEMFTPSRLPNALVPIH